MHKVGEPLTIDEVPVPSPRPTDVLVKVNTCGIVPNLGNVLTNFPERFPWLSLPELPAIFGLDAVGVVVALGTQVRGIDVGQRVYVNPGRYCNSCSACLDGSPISCASYAFNGYFGFSDSSQVHFDDYPYGGLGEYMTAPAYSLVRLPDSITDETASRLGYLGTSYRALRKANVGPRSTVLINGISGTLGIGTALLALALGAQKVLGTGRNRELLERVRLLAPTRIEVHSTSDSEAVRDWARRLTRGDGVTTVIDSLGQQTPPEPVIEALEALGRGGTYVDIGGNGEHIPIRLGTLQGRDQQIMGSLWFTTAQAQEMVAMAETGQVDLSIFEHEVYDLDHVNEALSVMSSRNGGFSNYVVRLA